MVDTDLHTLDIDIEWSTRLYTYLADRTGSTVDVPDIERDFDFKLEPVLVDREANVWHDPFSSSVLKQEIEQSLASLLREVDRACAVLPGLDPLEQSAQATNAASQACNVIWHRLVGPMTLRGASPAELKAAINDAYAEIAREAASRARFRYSRQLEGVKALQLICAAVCEQRDVQVALDEHGLLLARMLADPPPSLVEELTRLRVPLVELSAYVCGGGAAHWHAPCGAAQQIGVSRWALTYGSHVDTACVATVTELRARCGHDDFSALWHGVEVWPRGDHRVAVAIGMGGSAMVIECPVVKHVHPSVGLQVVATASPTEKTAVRSVRIVHVVRRLVEAGMLHPGRVKAESLLSMVSRYASNKQLQRERAIAMKDTSSMEVEGECESEGEEDEEDEEDEGEEQDDTRSDSVSLAVSDALEPYPVALASTSAIDHCTIDLLKASEHVPQSLQRDYVFCVLLRQAIAEHRSGSGVNISVTAVVNRLGQIPDLGPATVLVRGHTRASLQASVGWIFKKCIIKLYAWAAKGTAYPDLVSADALYGKLPSWVAGTKGLNLNDRGRAALVAFMEYCIQSMRGDAATFANWWFPSRSAKCHARRKQYGGERGPRGQERAE